MQIMIQNLPYFCLIWIGIGFILLMTGIFMLSYRHSNTAQYTEEAPKEEFFHDKSNMQELLSFFLQEEEKKNNEFRKSLMEAYTQMDKQSRNSETQLFMQTFVDPPKSDKYTDIIELYEKGIDITEIAKKLKMGKGEVELIISLYMMR